MKTNKKIIIVALSDWGGKTKEQIANTILSKLQVLDRGNVEEIIDKLYKCDIIPEVAIDQICQLIPEEKGIIIAEGLINFGGYAELVINNKQMDLYTLFKDCEGKKGIIKFIEDNK